MQDERNQRERGCKKCCRNMYKKEAGKMDRKEPAKESEMQMEKKRKLPEKAVKRK